MYLEVSGTRELATALWVFGSEVITQISLGKLSLLKLSWEKKAKPQRTYKCQRDFSVVSLPP